MHYKDCLILEYDPTMTQYGEIVECVVLADACPGACFFNLIFFQKKYLAIQLHALRLYKILF
jgi:hypothetical protein